MGLAEWALAQGVLDERRIARVLREAPRRAEPSSDFGELSYVAEDAVRWDGVRRRFRYACSAR